MPKLSLLSWVLVLPGAAWAEEVPTSTAGPTLPVEEQAVNPALEEAADARGKAESALEGVGEVRSILEPLTKLKLSGYVQGRFEYHEDSGRGLTSALRPATTTQFLVRRGRLKATYAGTLAELVLQIDATNRGVTLKDAEATFIEPWSGLGLRLTAGQFKWPFGYEVLQSSVSREMPERARVIRTLFPGERDRGVRLQLNHGVLRFAAALVNGNGTEDSIYTSNDSNRWKDLVGRLGIDLDWIVLGVSGYYGRALLTKPGDPKASPPVDTSYTRADKTRLGADVQAYVDVPGLGGLALKGELVAAQEGGASALGFWLLAVQNLNQELAVFVRADNYDPSGDADDDATFTLGGGLHYFFSGNVKATLVYEHPIGQKDPDPSDDTLTVQLQGMF